MATRSAKSSTWSATSSQHLGEVAGVDERRAAPQPVARPANEQVEAQRAGKEDGERGHENLDETAAGGSSGAS